MFARDLMTPNPRVATAQVSLREAATMMRDLNIGLIPIVDDRAHLHLRGVLTDRDIAIRCVAEGQPANRVVEDFMTTDHLATVGPDASLEEVIATMEGARVRRVLVVDKGRLAGVIAQADLALKEGPRMPLKVEELLERISAPAPAHN